MSFRDGTKKMSKSELSDQSRINLRDNKDLIDQKIQKAKTDSGSIPSEIDGLKNRKEAENFVKACLYPPKGYRSFGPIRGLLYGGADYGKHANDELLKFAMIETKEALENLDSIMTTPGLNGIYIGPADLSLAIGEEPSFDKPEGDKVYDTIMKILEHAKKNKIIAGIHNMKAEYAQKMINKGFQLVTVGSDQRFMSGGAKEAVSKFKKIDKKEGKGY